MTTTLPQNLPSSKLSNDRNFCASYRTYFETVLFPLWVDSDPNNPLSPAFPPNGFGDILTNLAILADGDRGLIETIQQWGLRKEHFNWELIKAFTSSSKPSSRYEDLAGNTDYEAMMSDLEYGLLQLGMQLDVKDARKALEAIADVCQDEAEFSKVIDGMHGLTMFDEKGWINAIVDFKRRLNDRRFDKSKNVVNDGLNPEDLKIKIKAFLEEKDQAKREVMLYELRKLGLGENAVNRIAAQLSQNGTIPRATRLSASEFRSRISGGKKWLVPGLIPQIGVTLITGPSGGGKSTFAFDLAGSVICGDSFMGESIKENGSVVFACSDEPTDESQERALLQGFFHSDNFEFLEQWNLGQMEMLEESIADLRPKLVLVDSFDSIHREAGFDENATQASKTIKQFNTLSQKYSCAFIVLHHENKDPKLSGVNKSRGSTAIVAAANAHIRIIGKDDNPETKYVKIEKMRGGATRSILCSVDYYNVRFEPEVNLEFQQDKDRRTALLSFFRSNPNRWFDAQELNQYLEWSGKGIYRYLKQLGDRGEINRKPNTMGRKGMVYGVNCTNETDPLIDLIPPSLVKSVSQEKIIAESIDIQEVEVSHNLVTSQSHLVISQSQVTIDEEPETLSLTDSHTCDQKQGDIEGGGLTSETVLIQTDVITDDTQAASLENPWNNTVLDTQPSGQWVEATETKNQTLFESFHVGDHVIKISKPDQVLTIVEIQNNGWMGCQDDWGISFYHASQLIPDEF